MADGPDEQHDQSQMDQSQNTATEDIEPGMSSESTTNQSEIEVIAENVHEEKMTGKIEHVLSGNKYFILVTGVTLNSHEDFIVQLKKKVPRLQEVKTVNKCDFILGFCPVASRAGTDIEAAVKKLHDTSATKPAVLVVLHHTFDPECFVPDSSRAVNRKNTITVDCLFHEDQGLLQCHKNDDAINHIETQLKPKIGKEWTEDERMEMEKSALLTDLDRALQSLRNKDIKLRNTETIIEEKDALLKDTNTKLEKATEELQEREQALHERAQQLKLKDTQIQEAQIQLEEKEERLVKKDKELNEKIEQLKVLKETNEKILSERDAVLMETNKKLQSAAGQIKEKSSELENMNKLLIEKDAQLMNTSKELETCKDKLEILGEELKDKERQLQEMLFILEQMKTELAEKSKQLEEKESLPNERQTELMERDKQTDPEPSADIRRRGSKEFLPPIMGGESSRPNYPVSVQVPELRLVLLGRTGSGKSAAGNTILGREERNQDVTFAATSTSTQQSGSTQGGVAGRKVSVVDTPDWFCPGLSLEKVRQDVLHCVHLSAPGPHAFLLVIPIKQPTGEKRGMLEKMEKIWGERCWRNTMILFTVTDELQKKSIEEFIQSGDQEVQRLVEKCGNRFHCLNIKESGDGSQVSELLEKIEKMVEGSRGKFYSSEIYLETESQIRAIETKILKERVEKRMSEEREMKEKLEKEVQASLRKIEGVIQEHEGDIRQLNDRTTELERKMKEEKDEEKKRELERELKQEVERRTEMEKKVKTLKEKRERERRELEEKHQLELEEIREEYEGEVRIEAEKSMMKIILPELQRNILASKTKMQEEFSRQMEEKERELETVKEKLFKLTETHGLLKEAYQTTLLSFIEQKPK